MSKIKLKKLLKNKRFVLFFIIFIIFVICMIFLLKLLFPANNSNYGNRLDGIDKISFTKKNQTSIINAIEENEKVTSAKMNIHGKIINIIYNVNKDVSMDDAKGVANSSLESFSKEVKEFYDIEFIITKIDEVGEETQVTNSDGTTTTNINKQFPIMGYKNSSSESIVW